MLTSPLPRAAAVAILVAASLLLGPTPVSAADKVVCPPDGGPCTIEVHTPGSPGGTGDTGGSGGNGGGPATCTWAGHTVPCRNDFGWFNPTDGCYWELSKPQPPAGDPSWKGHNDGAVYVTVCYPPDGIDPLGIAGVGVEWRATPPPGFGGMPTPAQLAAQAINQLPIRGPVIGIAPAPNGAGLVGLPVWMWTQVSPVTWGPSSATAAVPGLSVTATARAEKIVWSMGDGASVTCTSPGTPYKPSYGNRRSPDCGYDGYSRPSSTVSGGRYTVSGATTWAITWAGGGQSGTVTVNRTSTTTIDVDELQVVTS